MKQNKKTDISDRTFRTGHFGHQNATVNFTVTTTLDSTSSDLRIASWNLQIYGDSKASNDQLVEFYASKIRQYDVFFVQEIRDADGSAIQVLANKLPDYDLIVSERLGTTSSKEQYGVFYRKNMFNRVIKLSEAETTLTNLFERPPMETIFQKDNLTLFFWTEHTKPEAAQNEIKQLYNVSSRLRTVITGDLNADCSYSSNVDAIFSGFQSAIKDNIDTTVSPNTDCAYDRIYVSNDLKLISSGVDSVGINTSVSDHYIVWVEVQP